RFTGDEMVTIHPTGTQVWSNSSGSFAAGQLLGSGDTRDIAVADLSGNGKGDIVTASADGLRVFKHLGNLGNSFDPPLTLTAVAATSVVIADLDGDGDGDVVAALEGNAGIRVFGNDSVGNFAETDTIAVLGAVELAVGDVDSDGDPDVIAVRGGAGTVLLRNDGGAFASREIAVAADSVEVADIDGDSRSDLILGSAGVVTTWLSTGDDFRDSGARIAGAGTSDLVAIDLDHDGDADLMHGAPTGVTFHSGSLSGTFGDTVYAAVAELGQQTSNAVATGDLDGDGDLDQVTADLGDNRVWLNDGDGDFTFSNSPGHILGQGDSRAVVLGDLDHDGDLDAVIGQTALNGAANEIWQNDGAGNFALVQTFAPLSKTLSLALARFDGDGLPDIVVGNDGENEVFVNVSANGIIAFTAANAPFSIANNADLDRMTIELLVFDLDTDGDDDLVTVNQGTALSPHETQVWRKASTLYTLRNELTTIQMASAGTLGDYDGDGILDLAIGRQSPGGNHTVQLYRGLRTQLSTLPISVPTGIETVPSGLLLDDIDGDGIADLVIANRGAAATVMHGDGLGGFTLLQTLQNDQATDLAAADLDDDGDLDLIVTTGAAAGNRVYRNQ
ncbi:MAG: VCBS repeat-containing protein, partial [Planctomycetes bacterium]|nr:VCBS repeat-containing protein [Planctomycetota bacterium]